MKNGDFYTISSDATNHYEEGILRIEKYKEGKVWTAIVDDADQGYLYVKRFPLEDNVKKQCMNGSNEASKLILLSDAKYPRFSVKFGGGDEFREPLIIDADEFIAVKSFKAKGKRVSNYEIAEVTEIEPREVPEEELQEPEVVEVPQAPEVVAEEPKEEPPAPVLNTATGQWQLFGNDDEEENEDDDSQENNS